MLKHCLVKKLLADNLEKTGITVEGSGKFSLRYCKDNTERNYVIDFGDKNKMPSCTCIDWKRSCYPCKHFFIVFKKYSCWNWESISPLYRMSPYLNLDFGFEAKTKLTNDIPSVSTYPSEISNNEYEASITDQNEVFEMADPPKVRNTVRKSITSESLRGLLSELRSLSFLIEHDDDLLENTYKELNNLIRSVKRTVPKENCLPLLSNKIKKGPKHKGFNKYHKLPAPKRKSTKLKRVGEEKEKLLAA